MMTVLDVFDAIKRALEPLGIVGLVDVRFEGSRSTGWLGKPGVDDQIITVTIEPYLDDGDLIGDAPRTGTTLAGVTGVAAGPSPARCYTGGKGSE
jgi:hypothetical protein